MSKLKFTSFIKNQKDNDFAIDFRCIVDALPYYPQFRGTDEIESETLLGHFDFLSPSMQNKAQLLKALCELWEEWVAYKHIGLRYSEPNTGYVYFFRLINEPSIFKIGRTSTHPEQYLPSVEAREKGKFEVYRWLRSRYYDLIEKELHTYFKDFRIAREFFNLEESRIDGAVEVYRLIDEGSQVFPDDFEDDAIDFEYEESL